MRRKIKIKRKLTKKSLDFAVFAIWTLFFITSIVMAALVLGRVFSRHDSWIPMIPVGTLLISAIVGTKIASKLKVCINEGIIKKRAIFAKIGTTLIWAMFWITTIVMGALVIGHVFPRHDLWIPIIPIGCLLTLAIAASIFKHMSGEVRFCSKCGKKFEKKWEFCQVCGTKVLTTCPTCGVKVKGNPKFCHNCGMNLSEIKVILPSRTHVKYKVEPRVDTCAQCGAPRNPEANYCAYCGDSQH